MTAFISSAELERLFAGFLRRDPGLSERFIGATDALCAALSRRYGWSLPEDVRREVMAETACALLTPGARRFDPRRGTVKEFLTGFILNSVRRLRKVLYPPLSGQSSGERGKIPSLDELETGSVCPRRDVEQEIRNGIYVEQLLAVVPAPLREAIRAVHRDREPISSVAKGLGVCRFRLKREMDSFVRDARANAELFRRCA